MDIKKPGGGKQKYLLLLLVLGISLMLIGKLFGARSPDSALPAMSNVQQTNSQVVFKQPKNLSPQNITEYETLYKNELIEMLEQIQGVKKVDVMVMLDTTETKQYARDDSEQNQTTIERDKNGGERTIKDQRDDRKIVMIRNGDSEQPIVVTTERPKVRGILVVAQGAENLETKANIIEAITKVFDIGSNRVSVVPKKVEGE